MSGEQVVVVQNDGPSAMGLTGLIFSVLGWFTCGLLCIPGAFFSFAGLFSNKPKGLAIAGLIIGFPGVLFFAFMGAGLLAGILGIGAAASASNTSKSSDTPAVAENAIAKTPEPTPPPRDRILPSDLLPPRRSLDVESDKANEAVEEVNQTAENEPTPPESTKPVDPRTIVRTFTSGEFSVTAKVTGYKEGFVRLERDDGREAVLKVELLSEDDQQWLEENFGSINIDEPSK